MNHTMSRRERAEHLIEVVASERFLSKTGLGNEVPFFICPFPPEESLTMNEDRKDLVSRLANRRVRVLDINLYDLSIDILKERGVLDQLIDHEADTDKAQVKELLQGVLDPETHLIPKMGNTINSVPHDVIFLSGVGEVYPYIRSHSVLNNLQSIAKDRPTVLFFPGDYAQALATGSSLELFGQPQDDRYYRAFNILNYEV